MDWQEMAERGQTTATKALGIAVDIVVPKGLDWLDPIGVEMDRQWSAAILAKDESPEHEIAFFKCLLSVIGLLAVVGEVGRRGAKFMSEMN